MHGLGEYDFHARQYDPAIGRFTTVDPLAEKFYSWSPYMYCYNNPLKFVDPDGKNSYLLVWATQGNSFGHAAFAVDNYKQQMKLDNNGEPIMTESGAFATEFVPDGTVTVYDLNPGVNVGLFNATSDVSAVFGEKTTTMDKVTYGGKEADGVLEISTSFGQDYSTKEAMSDFKNESNTYNAASRNCSDYAKVGVNSSIIGRESVKGQESTLGIQYTTPNKLYRETKETQSAIGKSSVTEIKKPDDKIINGNFSSFSK